mmetsp:Transcript_20118/g.45778  ORF Transcript_20118/g.45778 Transcript_20118/m.45778 type:complete len:93 (+) Transcript_20118:60-338(+)
MAFAVHTFMQTFVTLPRRQFESLQRNCGTLGAMNILTVVGSVKILVNIGKTDSLRRRNLFASHCLLVQDLLFDIIIFGVNRNLSGITLWGTH